MKLLILFPYLLPFLAFGLSHRFSGFVGGDDKEKKFTLVIDPGHGGKDPGCIGFTGKTTESAAVLGIALKFGKMVEESFPDVNVIYTRKTDTFVEIHQRADIANRNNADLFVCIHSNSNKVKKVNGSETYVMGLHVTAQNLEVAKRENEVVLFEEDYRKKYDGFDPNSPEADIIFSLYQNAFLEQSIDFASMIQKHMKKYAGRPDRGVRQAGFIVLYKTAMPSVLIEAGFLTNQDEEKYLISEKGQEEIAKSLLFSFKEYRLKSKGEVPQIRDEKGIFFRVQVATSSKSIPLNAPQFSGLAHVEEYLDEGLFKYTAGGPVPDLQTATNFQSELRVKGFPSAFIVAFSDGKRISMLEALKRKEQSK
ncbi:MAG: N-acetylmuramoyl-L-alanine amidase [Bacteroidetes bacterium]|nr:N-acetylmuramoyl-L-alanine amidase [Bacteroidota bacterium]